MGSIEFHHSDGKTKKIAVAMLNGKLKIEVSDEIEETVKSWTPAQKLEAVQFAEKEMNRLWGKDDPRTKAALDLVKLYETLNV